MSTVDTPHEDYAIELPDWRKIEHITRLRMLDSYLLELNPHDTSEENRSRNRAYKQRAIFYAVAAQTVQGMLGTMFRRDPKLARRDPQEPGRAVRFLPADRGRGVDARHGRGPLCGDHPAAGA